MQGRIWGEFQGAEGTPWAPQGVPGTPCGFGRKEFLKCFLSNEVAATLFTFKQKK